MESGCQEPPVGSRRCRGGSDRGRHIEEVLYRRAIMVEAPRGLREKSSTSEDEGVCRVCRIVKVNKKCGEVELRRRHRRATGATGATGTGTGTGTVGVFWGFGAASLPLRAGDARARDTAVAGLQVPPSIRLLSRLLSFHPSHPTPQIFPTTFLGLSLTTERYCYKPFRLPQKPQCHLIDSRRSSRNRRLPGDKMTPNTEMTQNFNGSQSHCQQDCLNWSPISHGCLINYPRKTRSEVESASMIY